MSVAKILEVSAASSTSFEDAVAVGIARVSKTVKNVSGAWIQDQKVDVEDGKITRYRVTMKISFLLE